MNEAAVQPRWWVRYAWALLAVAAALLARWLAAPRLGNQLPYGSVLVATMIVAWFAGMRPALLVVAIGGPLANIIFLPPYWNWHSADERQRWGLVLFMTLGGVISLFGGFVHTQRARAEATAAAIKRAEAALREAHDELERRVSERTAELARTNDSLRASEQRFRLLVEGVHGYAMVMLDADGMIAAWNGGAAQLFDRTADIVGKPVGELIRGLDRAALQSRGTTEHDAIRGDGTTFPIELELTPLAPHDQPSAPLRGAARPGGAGAFDQPSAPLRGAARPGSPGDFDQPSAPLRGAARPGGPGDFDLLVCIVRDISERKRLEAITEQKQRRADELRRKADELEAENRRMREATRLQSEFLANMSHELRTPLNAIIGFADLLHGGLAGPLDTQQREFLGDILTSSRHLLQLINDVLDLAKVQSGMLDVAPEPVELSRVIAEVRDILRGLAMERRLDLDLQLATDLGNATVDPGKLRQILYNYVSNALKFTPEGGRVTIRAAVVDHGYRIEVEDTGIGIASEDLRYLFVAFRQLDSGATKRYQGTGLGLALTKRLAEAHGGKVGVHSVRGVGSTFWVELPRVAVARQAAGARH